MLAAGDARARAGWVIYRVIGGIEAHGAEKSIRVALAFSRAAFNKSLKLCNLAKQRPSTLAICICLHDVDRTAKATIICYTRMKGRMGARRSRVHNRLQALFSISIFIGPEWTSGRASEAYESVRIRETARHILHTLATSRFRCFTRTANSLPNPSIRPSARSVKIDNRRRINGTQVS